MLSHHPDWFPSAVRGHTIRVICRFISYTDPTPQVLSAPSVLVKRDGRWSELLVRELVTGDIVALKGGDIIPADCQVRKKQVFWQCGPPSPESTKEGIVFRDLRAA